MKRAFVRTGLTLLAASALLGGCLNLGDASKAPAVVYYVLNDAAPAAPAAAAAVPLPAATLRVLDTTTGNFYDTEQLVFSRSPDTRGLYQYARWTERPGKRFSELLQKRLAAQSGFASVAVAGGQVRGDMVLDTDLTEFYHEADTAPGSVRVQLRAELIDLKTRKLLGRQWFERRVPVASYDAAAAAKGFNQATTGVLDDLTAWLAALPNQNGVMRP